MKKYFWESEVIYRWAIGCCIGILIILIWFVFHSSKAQAHSWYEPSCCSDVDCHPVDDGVVDDMGLKGVAVQGYGILSASDPRLRWSRDNQDHICETPAKKLLCVYRRPPAT